LITVTFTMFVSALNVRYRDVQHLIGLALLVWFWMTPIVYGAGTVHTSMLDSRFGVTAWRVYLLNPLTWVVIGFQRALYHTPDGLRYLAPYSASQLAAALSIVVAVAAVAAYLSWRLYFSMSGDFAEEL
jgi:ABC-2 type transport system permease protein